MSTAQTPEIGSQAPADGAGKKRLDPSFKRNVLIISAAAGLMLLATVAMVAWRSGGAGDAASVNVGHGMRPQETGEDGLTPAMRDAIAKAEQNSALAAKALGQSSMPSEVAGMAEPIKIANGADASRGSPPGGAGAAPHAYEAPVVDQERLGRQREGLARQMAQWLGSSNQDAVERVEGAVRRSGEPSGGAAAPTAAPAAPTERADQNVTTLVGAYEMFSGETTAPIDTYRSKMVSARLTSGPLAGAVLWGKWTLQDEGLAAIFDAMRWNGEAFSIEARALSEITSTDALDADVDRRYLQRVVLPIAMGMAGAYAKGRADTGSTFGGIGPPGGEAYGAITPAPTRRQAQYAGVATGLEIAGDMVAREAARPVRFSLAERTPIGIVFTKPVVVKRASGVN